MGSRTLTFTGVDYPANVQGFLAGGDNNGAATMASDVNNVASSCPNTEIVMSGYSQGTYDRKADYIADSDGLQVVSLFIRLLLKYRVPFRHALRRL